MEAYVCVHAYVSADHSVLAPASVSAAFALPRCRWRELCAHATGSHRRSPLGPRRGTAEPTKARAGPGLPRCSNNARASHAPRTRLARASHAPRTRCVRCSRASAAAGFSTSIHRCGCCACGARASMNAASPLPRSAQSPRCAQRKATSHHTPGTDGRRVIGRALCAGTGPPSAPGRHRHRAAIGTGPPSAPGRHRHRAAEKRFERTSHRKSRAEGSLRTTCVRAPQRLQPSGECMHSSERCEEGSEPVSAAAVWEVDAPCRSDRWVSQRAWLCAACVSLSCTLRVASLHAACCIGAQTASWR
jgi:hypothetical protein